MNNHKYYVLINDPLVKWKIYILFKNEDVINDVTEITQQNYWTASKYFDLKTDREKYYKTKEEAELAAGSYNSTQSVLFNIQAKIYTEDDLDMMEIIL